MFELEEMQGCHSCVNEKDFDTEKEPCKSCNGFSHYENKFLKNTSITFINEKNNRLEDNMVYAIPLEDIDEFTMTVLPSEYELKIIYKYNFVLNEITEDGYYVFIKEH